MPSASLGGRSYRDGAPATGGWPERTERSHAAVHYALLSLWTRDVHQKAPFPSADHALKRGLCRAVQRPLTNRVETFALSAGKIGERLLLQHRHDLAAYASPMAMEMAGRIVRAVRKTEQASSSEIQPVDGLHNLQEGYLSRRPRKLHAAATPLLRVDKPLPGELLHDLGQERERDIEVARDISNE